MAETPTGPTENLPDEAVPQAPTSDRGVARALLQRRIEAARSHPDWAPALKMAAGLDREGVSLQEIEVSALSLFENGILSVADLFRVAGKQGLSVRP